MTRTTLAFAVAALALTAASASASAEPCAATMKVAYDASRLTATYELDLTPCQAVPAAGRVTMSAVAVRVDRVTGGYLGYSSRTVRCRAGVPLCSVRLTLPHPATEHETYRVDGAYDSDGRIALAGSVAYETWCSSVAGTVANCALPA
jgi:hypothetical protein